MRIAVCISGQPRTWRETVVSWNLLFNGIKQKLGNVEVDVFMHIWNFNTTPMSVVSNINNPHNILDESEFTELKEIFKPKDILIEASEVSNSRKQIIDDRSYKIYPTVYPAISWAAPQLYSIMRCGHLKRNYEIKHNFQYDVCVRMRFDANYTFSNRETMIREFISNLPLREMTIYSVWNENLNYFPFDLVGDTFFYSDSFTYDLLTSFYDWMHVIDSKLFIPGVKIEEIFAYYIRMFGIYNVRLTSDTQMKRLTD